MKKTFLYVCVVALLTVVFSSCLGNNESTTSNSNVFSVIRQNEAGTRFAVININGALAYVTGDGLSESTPGDAVVISYKVNLDNWVTTSLLKADYISISETFPSSGHKTIKEQPIDTTVNNSPFKAISIRAADQNISFLNKWLFQFSAEVMGDQNFDVIFSYDTANQKDKDGNALPDNTVIVDIVLAKTGVAGEGAAKTTKEKSIVVDFTSFRESQTPVTIPTDGVKLNIWFRYIYTNTSSKKDVNYWQPGVGLWYWNDSTSN